MSHNLPKPDWCYFVAFTKTAATLTFHPRQVPAPYPMDSYNGDVALQFYASASRTYADKQRKVAQAEHLERLEIGERVQEDLKAPFFLSITPPPFQFLLNDPYASFRRPIRRR